MKAHLNVVSAIKQLHSSIFHDSDIELTDIELENQNVEYLGARLKLNEHSVRYRKGKVTPTKAGLFVVAWEKDENNVNQAYQYDTAPDNMMVYCEVESHKGVFLFSKEVLLKNKILASNNQKGKMGFRVYPPWEHLKSPQAQKTQKWQSEFYIDLNTNTSNKLQTVFD
ncbi:MAG: MepB family protein [Proteiniphilum sp.]|nr:MepB family protein [Proteiniphilum sp.]